MENYIFISYSTKNLAKSKRFKELMEANGINCWMAPESIEVGSDYARAIPAAIKNCKVVVVLLSDASQRSQWVPKEVDLAFKYQKPILPIRIEKCEIVEPFDFYLSNVQAIPISMKRAESVQSVIESIKAQISLQSALASKKSNETVSVVTRVNNDNDEFDYDDSDDTDELEKGYSEFVDYIDKINKKPPRSFTPDITLLAEYDRIDCTEADGNAKAVANEIERIVSVRCGKDVTVSRILQGFSYSRYEIDDPPFDAVRKIELLHDELRYELGTMDVILNFEHETRVLYAEVPTEKRKILGLGDLLRSEQYINAKSKLTVAVGKDISGKNIYADLAASNYIISGMTGSGKTKLLHSFILSMLFRNSPRELKLVLIDPKYVEFGKYCELPHLLNGNIIDEPFEALCALKWAVGEMERRYVLLSNSSCWRISEYNQKKTLFNEILPEIVFVIDEFADLMTSEYKELIEDYIVKLAQKSRGAGIHLVLATQRPTVDVLTGIVKSNFSGRIALKTADRVSTHVILDGDYNAEFLTGRGDLLFESADAIVPVRVQGAYVSDNEIEDIVQRITYNK